MASGGSAMTSAAASAPQHLQGHPCRPGPTRPVAYEVPKRGLPGEALHRRRGGDRGSGRHPAQAPRPAAGVPSGRL